MVSSACVSLLLIIVCIVGSWCQQPALKVTHLELPPYVHRGEDVKLRCVYMNQNKPITSIKWFLNDEQFFRYMPYENPPTEFYPPRGENWEPKINIDPSRSNGSEVYLTNVNLSASGTYRCMVTEDGPFWRDDSNEANLIVTETVTTISTKDAEGTFNSFDDISETVTTINTRRDRFDIEKVIPMTNIAATVTIPSWWIYTAAGAAGVLIVCVVVFTVICYKKKYRRTVEDKMELNNIPE